MLPPSYIFFLIQIACYKKNYINVGPDTVPVSPDQLPTPTSSWHCIIADPVSPHDRFSHPLLCVTTGVWTTHPRRAGPISWPVDSHHAGARSIVVETNNCGNVVSYSPVTPVSGGIDIFGGDSWGACVYPNFARLSACLLMRDGTLGSRGVHDTRCRCGGGLGGQTPGVAR